MKLILKVTGLFALCLIILTSCNRDKATLNITDFSKDVTVKIEPYDKYPYTMMNIWVKGYTNDTILIKLDSHNNSPILKLSGKIDERWYTDYYGGGSKTMIFEPYKATDGTLEIKFEL